MAAARAALDELFVDDQGAPTPAPDRQRIAAAVAATEWTDHRGRRAGHRQDPHGRTDPGAAVQAVRPGVAGRAGRADGQSGGALTEAVAGQAGALGLPAGLTAKTLHRLLGRRRGSSTRFRHDAHNRLPYDVVVVDETSMVSLTMMARLFEALPLGRRLILMGDPDQLTSVDAGAVLADLVHRQMSRSDNSRLDGVVAPDLSAQGTSDGEPALSDEERRQLSRGIVRLSRGRRFNAAIAELADAVRSGSGGRCAGGAFRR